MKVILVLGVSFLLMSVETWLKGIVPVSSLLAVVSMACVIKLRSTEFVSRRLSEKFGKLWLAAEVILFVLVGAAVNIRYTLQAGAVSLLMLAVSLAFRSIGVLCCRLVLSVAVLAILITAPLGAIGIDASYRKLLQKQE